MFDGRRRTLLALALGLAISRPIPAAAQFSARCSSGSESELRHDMREHTKHMVLLDEKFRHVTYGGGPGVRGTPDVRLEAVVEHLRKLAPRRAAVLFQARESGSLCTWLVTPDGITSEVGKVGDGVLEGLRPRLLRALGVPTLLSGRAPALRGGVADSDAWTAFAESAADVLREGARLLVPDRIAAELERKKIDTLVLVPAADVGTFPFAALPVGGRALVERASIVVAPGFEAFARPSPATPRPFDRAVIVGNPTYPADARYTLPDLPGAEAEAREVAALVSGEALTGKAATIARVRSLVSATGRPPNLVYLATHGLSDAENPLDGSTLWLADGRWSARAISRLPLSRGRPLVVLSACQTGLGKTFDVGTIGMSRAWMKAGASRVVMSLWRVDDAATKVLMTRFLALAATNPVDRALQQAMLETRAEVPDVARWASFAVLGLPEAEPVR